MTCGSCLRLHAPAHLAHSTSYRYEGHRATSVIQMLRLDPAPITTASTSRAGAIDVSADCRLDQREDAFGNITHAFTADGL